MSMTVFREGAWIIAHASRQGAAGRSLAILAHRAHEPGMVFFGFLMFSGYLMRMARAGYESSFSLRDAL